MDKSVVLDALKKLSASLNQMVVEGRRKFEQSKDINDFAVSRGAENHHGLLALYPVQLYTQCFKSLSVKSRKELEVLWSRYSSDASMQEAGKELLLAEESYRAFMEELDSIMNAYEEEAALPVVSVGENIRTNVGFMNGSTGSTVLLHDLLKECKYTLFVLRKHYV